MQQQNGTDETTSVDDNISKLYQIIEFKGKGAYGVIWKAIDKQSKKIVAVKKVFDAFTNDTDAQRTYREVIYLQQLVNHENIVKLIRIHRALNMKDLYMVFEYVESDLHKVIRANLLSLEHTLYILYQLLKCLKYIHSGGLIHRDLKPSNILIDSECRIKIADFGLARLATEIDESTVMTEYVATRWYRAPEILMGSPLYSKAVDMWSVGCILGEMIISKSMFAGSSTLDQLEKIVEIIGRPTQDDLNQINSPLAEKVFREITVQKKKTIFTYIKASEKVTDFISKCLTWNPKKRMTIDEALQHRLLDDLRGSEPELVYPSEIKIDFPENIKLDKKKYRDMLYKLDTNYQKQLQIKQLTQNEEQLLSSYKNYSSNKKMKTENAQIQYAKFLNNNIETKQLKISKNVSKELQYQTHSDIQNQMLLSQQIYHQNIQYQKIKVQKGRVKTLPDSYIEKLQPPESKSPNRGRYFSQNKIFPQPCVQTSSTPIRSNSQDKTKFDQTKFRKYNNSVDNHQTNNNNNNSNTVQKLLQSYLKPKQSSNYNIKKIAIRNKNNMDNAYIKKHLASLNNIDVSSLISNYK